jgi:hypothetical protein
MEGKIVTFNLGWQADEARKESNSGFIFLALASLKDEQKVLKDVKGVLHGHYKPTGNDGDKTCYPDTYQMEDDDTGAVVEIVFGPGVIVADVLPHGTEVGTIPALIADYTSTEEAYFSSCSYNEYSNGIGRTNIGFQFVVPGPPKQPESRYVTEETLKSNPAESGRDSQIAKDWI